MIDLCRRGREVLQKPRPYQKSFKPQKPASKLTKKETLEYFLNCDIPRNFASPWPRRAARDEYRMGANGSLVYHGDLAATEDYKKSHAKNEMDYVELDTYFNKVVQNATKKGWINLYLEDGSGPHGLTPIMLSDVWGIRLAEAFKAAETSLAEAVRQREERENQHDLMPPSPMVCNALLERRALNAEKITRENPSSGIKYALIQKS